MDNINNRTKKNTMNIFVTRKIPQGGVVVEGWGNLHNIYNCFKI